MVASYSIGFGLGVTPLVRKPTNPHKKIATRSDLNFTMTEEQETPHLEGDWDLCKVFVSRIPAQFDETTLKRLLEEKLEPEAVVNVSLVYKNDEEGDEKEDVTMMRPPKKQEHEEHRGFAFCTLKNPDLLQRALELGTIRGGVKATSSKKFTIYLRPVVREDEQESSSNKQICFLWSNNRCPYGEECKFTHEGDGGCLEKNKDSKKKKKCFAFKQGKCKRGDECPFSHDFEVTQKEKAPKEKVADNTKDCINWKSKGKCRKGDKCPYRHDEAAREAVLAKKKRKLGIEEEAKADKINQPLCVRVFGLNYDTKEEDVREFFQECGKIMEVTFPMFEDSGRSKGYCGVMFQSPKAVATAVELDGQELHGRWLQIQAGKMYLKQWEENHEKSRHDPASAYEGHAENEDAVGEFGQKVKRRKKHGYKE